MMRASGPGGRHGSPGQRHHRAGVFDATTTIDEVPAEDRPVQPRPRCAARGGSRRWPRPDLVPSSPRLAQREHQLGTDPIGAQDRLRVALDGLDDRYDDVIIDCPPSLGLLTVNAPSRRDRVLIVAEPAAWEPRRRRADPPQRPPDRRSSERSTEVAGIVVNRLGRTRDAGYWFAQLQETHGDLPSSPPSRPVPRSPRRRRSRCPSTSLRRDGAEEAGDQFAALARALESRPAADAVTSPADRTAGPHRRASSAPTSSSPRPASPARRGTSDGGLRPKRPRPCADGEEPVPVEALLDPDPAEPVRAPAGPEMRSPRSTTSSSREIPTLRIRRGAAPDRPTRLRPTRLRPSPGAPGAVDEPAGAGPRPPSATDRPTCGGPDPTCRWRTPPEPTANRAVVVGAAARAADVAGPAPAAAPPSSLTGQPPTRSHRSGTAGRPSIPGIPGRLARSTAARPCRSGDDRLSVTFRRDAR